MTPRELDIQIAKWLGYRVAPLQGTEYYVLHKPHRRLMNGIGSLLGPGPARSLPGKPGRAIGFSEEETWTWVPLFSTNTHHAEELRTHLCLIMNQTIPAHIITPKQLAAYCLQLSL